MKRNEQVARIFRVLHYLEINPRGLAAREIREKLISDGFPCLRETVSRDLDALSQGLLPIHNEGVGVESVWKIDSLVRIKDVSFTYNERLALFMVKENFENFRNTPLFPLLENFFLKMEKLLGPKHHEALNEFSKYIDVHSGPVNSSNVSQDIFDTVHAALAEGHMLEIDYKAASGSRAGQVALRRIGPENIHIRSGSVYLVGTDLEDGQTKLYALSRIASAKLLTEPYQSHGFDPEIYFKDRFGIFSQGTVEHVELLVKEPMASFVSEKRWHDSQRVVRTEDGIRLTMEVKINDEFIRWLLSLGTSCTVVGPENLREKVGNVAQEIAAIHLGKKAS